jgi:hypothetical protein
MGGLLAFRVGNYDNTAEREQFRFLCQQLKTHFGDSGEFCVFADNYNIGCELDALFIKKDAIISIEFKNYGGNVVANENGEWTADGVAIKGGSRKTVLQQARINHSTVKRELKALGVESKHIKDVPHLIIFHQPIELNNRLSSTNKSWLHITDDNHFIEKLDDITCPKTDLDPLGIVNLAEMLNLNSFYLTEFSNAKYEQSAKKNQKIDVIEDIKLDSEANSIRNTNTHKDEFDKECVIIEKIDTLPPKSDNSANAIPGDSYTEEQIGMINFTKSILSAIHKNYDYSIELYDTNKFIKVANPSNGNFSKSNVIVVYSEGIDSISGKLSKFIGKDVMALNSNSIYWELGTEISPIIHQASLPIQQPSKDDAQSTQRVLFRKSRTVLPHWLDRYIFESLGAKYSPEHTRYEYNLDLSKEEIAIYLGTYFPRSYSESFCIYDNLLKNENYHHIISKLSIINVLDIGCGTGGELVGLITALTKYLSISIIIHIDAFDGNEYSLSALRNIIMMMKSQTHHTIELVTHFKKYTLKSKIDTNDLEDQVYEFIFCNKMVCELISHDVIPTEAYRKIAKNLCPLLSDDGVFLLLDVTIKDTKAGVFYPLIMNKELNDYVNEHIEFSTLLPLACSKEHCRDSCFMQQTFQVSHSRKSNDESKVCYRILCHKELKDKIVIKLEENTQHIIHSVKYKDGDKTAICYKSHGNKVIDSFNINL